MNPDDLLSKTALEWIGDMMPDSQTCLPHHDLRAAAAHLFGFDVDKGYDPDMGDRPMTAVLMIPWLEDRLDDLGDEELERIITVYDNRDNQLEAKIRVMCKRQLRMREKTRQQAEFEALQRDNPTFGMF